MAKTNKQQKEIDELIIERNNLIDRVDELEDKNDEQFKTIINYEKELEKQDKEIEELKEENHDLDTMVINMKERIKELEEQKKDDWRLERYNKLQERTKELYELTKTSNINKTKKYYEQSQEVIKLLQEELKTQIIQKNTYKKENKRLKKRRRSGRYEPKKVYEKLARGRLCYIPEGDYLPTKVHESLIDAMEEGHRLADKTGNQVYIVGTYCKI